MNETYLVKRFIRMFKCDTARITSPGGTLFLIIGYKRRSEGEWFKGNGKPFIFDYVDETVIVSGKTNAELVASARNYKKLCGLIPEEYLRHPSL